LIQPKRGFSTRAAIELQGDFGGDEPEAQVALIGGSIREYLTEGAI
jgi:hypothetical protein